MVRRTSYASKFLPAKWAARLLPTGLLLLTLAVSLAVTGCGGNGDGAGEPEPTKSATPTQTAEDVVITIGSLTDLTGPSARGMQVVDKALEDVIRYFNDENLIPGIRLELIKYDGKLDSTQNEPGYEWLIENGADVIWTGVPGAPEALRPRIEGDGIVLFAATIHLDDLSPPGYIFTAGMVPEVNTLTQLKWVAGNHWDYETNGPATIGGAGWDDRHSPAIFAATQAYAAGHPDQFEWVGGHLTNFTFSWTDEVAALKDIDYVLPPNLMTTFAKQYHEAGGKGTILAGEPQVAFLEQIHDGDLWEQVDGTLVIRGSGWWGDDDEMVKLAEGLLERYNPDSAEAIKRRGVGYLAVQQAYIVVDIIREAVETVGAANFDSAALYEAAQSFSLEVDGLERYSFTETKRNATNYYAMSVMSAEANDLVRIDDRWFEAVYEP